MWVGSQSHVGRGVLGQWNVPSFTSTVAPGSQAPCFLYPWSVGVSVALVQEAKSISAEKPKLLPWVQT